MTGIKLSFFPPLFYHGVHGRLSESTEICKASLRGLRERLRALRGKKEQFLPACSTVSPPPAPGLHPLHLEHGEQQRKHDKKDH